jgi:hypothetical protein
MCRARKLVAGEPCQSNKLPKLRETLIEHNNLLKKNSLGNGVYNILVHP